MIKVRGWQVSPAELEAVLLLHPDISDAAVIGVRLQQNTDGEFPRAYAVRKLNSYLSEGEVKSFMGLKVAKFKNLDGGVVFVDTIPRSSTGKILKSVLKDRAMAEIKAAQNENTKKPIVSTSLSLTAKQSFAPDRVFAKFSANSSHGNNERGLRGRRNSI